MLEYLTANSISLFFNLLHIALDRRIELRLLLLPLCRFPERMHSSMEANGLFVSQVCKDNGVKYYYGPDSICFVGCFLFR